MDYLNIGASEAAELLEGITEDYYRECKSREVKPGKLDRWVSAFGNSSGGELFVGIDETERGTFDWNGFPRVEDANAHVSFFQGHYPASDVFQYALIAAEGLPGHVLRVTINKTQKICKTADNRVYIRANASVKEITDNEESLRVLSLQKGISSWEDETYAAPLGLVTESEQIKEFADKALTFFKDPETWLRNQLMVKEGRPTVAALVLFADEPQVVLPKASVMVYRYASKDKVGQRKDLAGGKTYNIEGSAIEQIRGTVAKTTELIESVMGPDLQPISYPAETLHEIITNAIIHRDYSIADNVRVRVFDDRVEVESPGKLPGHVTPKNLPGARFSRNERIERMLHKFPDAPNKNVGEGMETAFSAMKAERLAPPVVTETDTGVIVYIKHEPLDSPATMIMDYLSTHATITNREARELTNNQSESSVRRTLRKLVDSGAVEQVPGTNRGGYKYRATGTVPAEDDTPMLPIGRGE